MGVGQQFSNTQLMSYRWWPGLGFEEVSSLCCLIESQAGGVQSTQCPSCLVCLKSCIWFLNSFTLLHQICDELGVKRPTSVKVFSGKSESGTTSLPHPSAAAGGWLLGGD